VGSPAGELDMLKPPFNLSGFEPRLDPVPALGAHSHAILSELGYGEREVDALVAAKVI
jgi:crotonobetainyl-CoA:carnitine CoA-transferase CaiB-like acyl-CoA transferase